VTRPLPAHLVAAGAAAGLALANLVRLHWPAPLLAAAPALLAAGRSRIAAAVLVVGLGGWWWGSVRLDALDRSVLAHEVGSAGPAEAVTTAEARRGTFAARQFATVTSFDGRTFSEPVLLDLPLARAPPQGARIRFVAEVRRPRPPSHGFDERAWLHRQGVHVVLRLHRWRLVGRRGGVSGAGDRLRSWLRRASAPGLTGERRAVLEGVLLGDDNGLTPGLKTAFRRAGLYHLLAVSGQNVVLLVGGVLGLAVCFGLPRAGGHLAALAAIAAYVLAVGPQASVVRAAVAGGVVSLAWLLGRGSDRWHALLVGAVALLAWSPYAVFDPGFQLSFAAVAAIFLGFRPLRRELDGYPLPPLARDAVALSAVCGVATAPILWAEFAAVPLLGVVANVLVEAAVPLLLGLAFATAAVGPVAPPLAAALAWANGWVAAYVAGCARAVAALPGAQATGGSAALAAAGGLVLAAYAWRRWRPT